MIINSDDSNKYKIIFDINDLNKYEINLNSFCGNLSKIKIFIEKILETKDFSSKYEIHNLELITFNFKVFNLFFEIKQKNASI